MMNEKQWHQMDAAEALQQLGSSAAQGLSAAEAGRRLAEQGVNEIQAAPPIEDGFPAQAVPATFGGSV